MKNKLIISIILCIVVLISSFYTADAATTTITATSSTVNSGEEITVTLTSSVSLSGYTISVDSSDGCTFKSVSVPSGVSSSPNGSTIGAMSSDGTKTLATYKFTASSITEDKKCSIKFSITGVLGANNEEFDNASATATITVKAPITSTIPDNSENTGSNGSSGNTSTPKSTEARLSNIWFEPKEYDFTGFKKDQTEYPNIEVPYKADMITIKATEVDSKATVSGTGNVSLKEGESKTVKITVTAEDGKNTKTYTLKIKRRTAEEEAKETSEARLSSLGIKPEEYDFTGFKSEQTEYTAEVPNDVEEIEVYATAMNSKAQITGTGMISLKEGKNTIPVEVIAEDGTKKTYTIEVTRKEAENNEGEDSTEGKFGLTTLSIKGQTLSPDFKIGTYEYTIGLKENLSSLEIEAIASDEEATVEIIGNENLQEGENTITILVTNSKTDETATYQIIVNKNLSDEAIAKTSWLKPSTWGQEEKIKILIVVVLIILIICAIILKIKIAKEAKGEEDVEFPGADELDKALAEHQELSGEESEEKIDDGAKYGMEKKDDNVDRYGMEEIKEQNDEVYSNEGIATERKAQIDEDESNRKSRVHEELQEFFKNDFDYQNDSEGDSSKRKGKHF